MTAIAMKKVRNRPPQINANAVEMSAKRANVQIDVASGRHADQNQAVVTTASAVDARKGIPWR